MASISDLLPKDDKIDTGGTGKMGDKVSYSTEGQQCTSIPASLYEHK